MDFSYLLKKISDSPIINSPFQHIQINDLFEPEDFEQILNSSDIKLPPCNSDKALFDSLLKSAYRIIEFPGCTTDMNEYIKWHKTKSGVKKTTTSCSTNTSCESFGTVLRLTTPATDIIKCLQNFLMSEEFVNCISSKFNIEKESCNYDAGIQKYLDGYEISPHPDIRRKALTYMVNINSAPNSQKQNHHTSYLQFKDQFSYVKNFWEGNEKFNRCWVPWEWCDIKKQQTENNSIVIFSPSNETMHAVKADYDHLTHQRTQLYGNLWYKECKVESMPNWEQLLLPMNIETKDKNSKNNMVNNFKSFIPFKVKSLFKKNAAVTSGTHVDRKT